MLAKSYVRCKTFRKPTAKQSLPRPSHNLQVTEALGAGIRASPRFKESPRIHLGLLASIHSSVSRITKDPQKMSVETTRFRKIKLDELKKILPEAVLAEAKNHNLDQETKKIKDRAGAADPPKGNSP